MSDALVTTVFENLRRMGGLLSTLGIDMERGPDGELRCRMAITQRHSGAPMTAHGGSLTTLLDSALGMRALSHAVPLGLSTSTVELKVNFLRPARVGQTLVTSTTVQSAGRSLLVISGAAEDADTGERVAFAVGTFNLYAVEGLSERLQAAAEAAESEVEIEDGPDNPNDRDS
ncbi:thioesterase family protein [Plesiocystis pacifica SIR-1]|uniref:Thioesterase family protein n=1 Tax=Plesiocystis pacifica SIR-1 TaxID=391625 RepID=A6G8Q9_9BACT|nr:PaaI family thioesterase [Plesiocystis pacifica]EDM77719.1 thioesterase family protein [Plesiocystis pacifica SIR-1]